jgi:3-phosphoshikimate 1-carboxyvinyltransferase
MRVTVSKSELKGRVVIPSSKSQTIRGLMCAALAGGESVLVNPLVCDDTAAAAAVLGQVGIGVQRGPDAWRVRGGAFRAPSADLYCGESAATLRFMTALCSLVPGPCRLVGGPSLSRRPVRILVEALGRLGVACSLEGDDAPPVNVTGGTLVGGETELPGHISSQFLSALLLIAPLAQKEVTIRLTSELKSRPYLLMTVRCQEQFGVTVRNSNNEYIVPRQQYRPVTLPLEGDWSSASYFLALGALSGGIDIENVNLDSLQGDKVVLDFLRRMGAVVRVSGDRVSVSRGSGTLRAVDADLSDCIDLLPTLAVLAALADGVSRFTGIERARLKESDRVTTVRAGLEALGVTVIEDINTLTVTNLGKSSWDRSGEPVVIDSRDDHRIAMAFGALGAAVGGITVTGAECVAKTYPGFWEALKSIGGRVEIYE